jgi:hypothetical protein
MEKQKNNFLDLKLQVFHNKKNGQSFICLPKKKLRKYNVPEFVTVRVEKVRLIKNGN